MTPIPARAPTRLRWPMIFGLAPADASLLTQARHHFDLRRVYPGVTPDLVQRTFLSLAGDEPWAPGFLGIDWHTPPGEHAGAVMDELYTFMAMRVRVIEHVPAHRSIMVVERWSLPIATRMVQLIEVGEAPEGATLRYLVAYDAPWIFAPFHPPVAALFRRWFEASLDGLGRSLARMAPRGAVSAAGGP